MLHVTNGDCAAVRIREAGIPGAVLPWLDVLHEGPVPAGLSLDELRPVRARFIAESGWADLADALGDLAARDAALAEYAGHDEVVLWFEHDLYDQLQLLQVLDFFAGRELGGTRLSLVAADEYLGPAAPARIQALFPQRREVSPAQLGLGRRAWAAFRSPTPAGLGDLLREDTSALPFLAGALVRHLEQFPSTRNGLSRSEEQALQAIAEGAQSLGEAFARSQEREERPFLGDATFALYLETLRRCAPALVAFDGPPEGQRIAAPRTPERDGETWERRVTLTEAGREVLDGRRDRVRTCGIERWLGGVRLSGREVEWRWDPEARRLRPRAD